LSYKQALTYSDRNEWVEATNKELQQFADLKAMLPIKLNEVPEGANITKSKIVYKLKLLPNGEIDKYKARLVAKGYTQEYGVDYTENFSPTPQIAGIRFVLIFILQHQLKKLTGDVSGAFLNAELKETVYLRLPEGLEFQGSEIVQLLKSLYGLKQAGRDWNDLQDKIIRSFDPELRRSQTEPCIYFKITVDCIFIISVHVDDYIVGYNNDSYMKGFFEHYQKHVKITTSNKCDFILQMSLEWSTCNTELYLSQNRQIQRLIEKYNLIDSKQTFKTPMEAKLDLVSGSKDDLPDVPYAQLVCALLFIARCTRPSILFSVTLLCRYLTNYTQPHFKAAMRILTYLKCTLNLKLVYRVTTTVKPLQIYIDSDWGGDKETGRSTSGGIIFLYGNPVAWFCQKQSDVSLSTSEAEYKTQTYAFKEGMYFINLIQSEMDIQLTPVETLIDNIGAAYMAEQVVTNKKTKHISLSYHYAGEQVQIFKNYYLTYVNTTLNCSDIFTKALDRGLFERHRNYIFKIEDEVGNNNNNN
jgi:hypothetical protein